MVAANKKGFHNYYVELRTRIDLYLECVYSLINSIF